MFCPNCGNKINDNVDFCPNCGFKVASVKSNENNVIDSSGEQTTTEKTSKAIKEKTSKFISNVKSFVINYKIVLIILIIIIFITIFGYKALDSLAFFDKLKWSDKYSDLDLNYVTQSKIKLGVDFSKEDEIDKIIYETNCGKVKKDGLEVIWDLSESTGQCKITASYKAKKISKEYNIINNNTTEHELAIKEEIDYDSDEDLDLDGLTNKEEKDYGTNPVLSDTDMDGLDDKYELFTSKTDPLKADTDGDGLNDYDEIQLGLDPLKSDSKGDGIKDGERKLTYEYTSENLKLTITGKGNIASTTAEINNETKISGKKGLIDKLYTFSTTGALEEAIITIPYSDEELTAYSLKEENLSIYYYNEKEAKYEKIETILDKNNKTLSATLKHFSNYVVGDKEQVEETINNQILFVLDNSWSMYTNDQYKEITGKTYTSGFLGENNLEGFDKDGLRFTLTSNLVSKLIPKNFKIGLSEFRYDYAIESEIGSDEETIQNMLKSMNGSFITSREGTNIGNALKKGIQEFSAESDNKYIVLLTDGQDTELKQSTQKILESATKNNVKICTIGFGDASSNAELFNIANGTGCKYYSSENASGLSELFENIGAELNDNLIDINGDKIDDGIIIADSGFRVNRDGFSFANYGSNYSSGGHCYGMATFAELYYKKVMPQKFDSKTVGDLKSNAYDLSNTYFKYENNLYGYKLTTNVLKYTFGYEYFNEERPADYFLIDEEHFDGKRLRIKDDYLSLINSSGLYDVFESESDLTKDEKIERWGVNYESYDDSQLNEDKMQTSSVINNSEKQLFNAIYAGFIKQKSTTFYSSGTNIILWLRNAVGSETTTYKGANGFINLLKSRLNDKDAPVISADYSNGLHAINAISLVQDLDDSNHYYIGVYDNNYPGEKRYVDIKCNKDSCTTLANEYYKKSNEPIRISPSLEDDLAYFNN